MDQQPTTAQSPAQQDTAPQRRGVRRRALIAHLLTALLATALSQLTTFSLLALQQPPTPAPATPTLVPTATVPPTVTATVSGPLNDTAQLQLDVRGLQADRDQLWSALYLLRTAVLLDDAVTALAVNERSEADRALLAARQALDRAYQLSAEQRRDPIDQIRLQVARLRDDLDLRPEGADRRLRQLRRLVLSLVDEG